MWLLSVVPGLYVSPLLVVSACITCSPPTLPTLLGFLPSGVWHAVLLSTTDTDPWTPVVSSWSFNEELSQLDSCSPIAPPRLCSRRMPLMSPQGLAPLPRPARPSTRPRTVLRTRHWTPLTALQCRRPLNTQRGCLPRRRIHCLPGRHLRLPFG